METEYGVIVVAPAEGDPIDFAAVKRHIKADRSTDDNTIREMVSAARELVEDHTGLTLINTEYQMVFDAWPTTNQDQWWDGVREGAITELLPSEAFELPRGPLVSVTHIKTYAQDGTPTTFSAANYILDRSRRKPRIGLVEGATWPIPGRRFAGIEIQFVCGYGLEPKDVDATLRLGMMMQTAYFYQNRGDYSKLDPKVEQLLDRKRIKRL